MIDWIMYAEIHNLKRQGFKKAKVAKKLGIRKRCQALLRKFYKTLQLPGIKGVRNLTAIKGCG